MKTIFQLRQDADRLRKVTDINSISPEDTFGLQSEVLEYLTYLEQNFETLGIHQVYKTFAAMGADTSPIGTDGKALRYGQLVLIWDAANTSQAESGNIYAYQAPGWELVGNANETIISELMNYLIKANAVYVDRGKFITTPDEPYHFESRNAKTGVYETSDVWYLGCKWRCNKDKTTDVPRWGSSSWIMIEGNPNFTVGFAETEGIFNPDQFDTTLTIVAKLYNQDVTADILDGDVVWTRYSVDDSGIVRTESDTAWALKREGAGKQIHLTKTDCDFNGYVPPILKFICTVTLREGAETPEVSGQAVFGY
jgi:hypothetical protein